MPHWDTAQAFSRGMEYSYGRFPVLQSGGLPFSVNWAPGASVRTGVIYEARSAGGGICRPACDYDRLPEHVLSLGRNWKVSRIHWNGRHCSCYISSNLRHIITDKCDYLLGRSVCFAATSRPIAAIGAVRGIGRSGLIVLTSRRKRPAGYL